MNTGIQEYKNTGIQEYRNTGIVNDRPETLLKMSMKKLGCQFLPALYMAFIHAIFLLLFLASKSCFLLQLDKGSLT